MKPAGPIVALLLVAAFTRCGGPEPLPAEAWPASLGAIAGDPGALDRRLSATGVAIIEGELGDPDAERAAAEADARWQLGERIAALPTVSGMPLASELDAAGLERLRRLLAEAAGATAPPVEDGRRFARLQLGLRQVERGLGLEAGTLRRVHDPARFLPPPARSAPAPRDWSAVVADWPAGGHDPGSERLPARWLPDAPPPLRAARSRPLEGVGRWASGDRWLIVSLARPLPAGASLRIGLPQGATIVEPPRIAMPATSQATPPQPRRDRGQLLLGGAPLLGVAVRLQQPAPELTVTLRAGDRSTPIPQGSWPPPTPATDARGPRITLATPWHQTTRAKQVTVAATISDPAGVTRIRAGRTPRRLVPYQADQSAPRQRQVRLTFPLRPGTNTLYLAAEDSHGNVEAAIVRVTRE